MERSFPPKISTSRLHCGAEPRTPSDSFSARRISVGSTFSTVDPVGTLADVHAVEMELVKGRRVLVIALERLLATKSYLERPKDTVVEAELRAIAEPLEEEG